MLKVQGTRGKTNNDWEYTAKKHARLRSCREYGFKYDQVEMWNSVSIEIYHPFKIQIKKIKPTKMEGIILTNLGRNSVSIERFGGRVTAPIKRTTLGCRSLRIILI